MRIILCDLKEGQITELLTNNYTPPVDSVIISEGVMYTVVQLRFNDDEDILYVYVRKLISLERLLTLIHKEFSNAQEMSLSQLQLMAGMIKNSHLLQAVKYCKETLNIGLKEAKDIVDFIKNDYGDLL